MKSKLKIIIRCIWTITTSTMIGPVVLADTPAFSSGGYTTNQPPSFTGTKGWAFSQGSIFHSDDIWVTQLGVFDANGDGLANSHAVGIWTANGTLLASTTIPAGTAAPLVDGYRYMPIAPVLFSRAALANTANQYDVIAAEYSAGDADDLVTPRPGAVAGGLYAWYNQSALSYGYYGLATGLPFPNRNWPGDQILENPAPPFLEVNFQFGTIVPEPSVSFLLAPGLLYLFLCNRKSSTIPPRSRYPESSSNTCLKL